MLDQNYSSQEIIIHFDVKDHLITIDEFYQTAKTIQTLADIFNQLFFDSKPTVATYVHPPQKGGFIADLCLLVIGGAIYVGKDELREYFKGMIESFLGKSSKDLGIEHGDLIKKFLHNDIEKTKLDSQKISCFLSDAIRSFLGQENKVNSSNKTQISENLTEAIKVKSKFYTMCAKSGRIKGLGFSKDHNFPIKQSDFIKHIIAEPIQTDDIQRRYELHEVTIIAPVNVEDSQVQWKTKDKNTGKRISFFMTDGNFRNEFFGGLYPLKETKKDDEMLVYVEYINTIHPNGKKYEKRQAIKVYRFNDRNLAEVPESIKLNTPYLNANPNQGELFDVKTIGTKKINL